MSIIYVKEPFDYYWDEKECRVVPDQDLTPEQYLYSHCEDDSFDVGSVPKGTGFVPVKPEPTTRMTVAPRRPTPCKKSVPSCSSSSKNRKKPVSVDLRRSNDSKRMLGRRGPHPSNNRKRMLSRPGLPTTVSKKGVPGGSIASTSTNTSRVHDRGIPSTSSTKKVVSIHIIHDYVIQRKSSNRNAKQRFAGPIRFFDTKNIGSVRGRSGLLTLNNIKRVSNTSSCSTGITVMGDSNRNTIFNLNSIGSVSEPSTNADLTSIERLSELGHLSALNNTVGYSDCNNNSISNNTDHKTLKCKEETFNRWKKAFCGRSPSASTRNKVRSGGETPPFIKWKRGFCSSRRSTFTSKQTVSRHGRSSHPNNVGSVLEPRGPSIFTNGKRLLGCTKSSTANNVERRSGCKIPLSANFIETVSECVNPSNDKVLGVSYNTPSTFNSAGMLSSSHTSPSTFKIAWIPNYSSYTTWKRVSCHSSPSRNNTAPNNLERVLGCNGSSITNNGHSISGQRRETASNNSMEVLDSVSTTSNGGRDLSRNSLSSPKQEEKDSEHLFTTRLRLRSFNNTEQVSGHNNRSAFFNTGGVHEPSYPPEFNNMELVSIWSGHFNKNNKMRLGYHCSNMEGLPDRSDKMEEVSDHSGPSVINNMEEQPDRSDKMEEVSDHSGPSVVNNMEEQPDRSDKMEAVSDHNGPSVINNMEEQLDRSDKMEAVSDHSGPSVVKNIEGQPDLTDIMEAVSDHSGPTTVINV